MAIDLYVGRIVQHAELGKGRVEEVWPELNGKSFFAQVNFDSGACVTCKDTTLQGVKDGNS